MAPRLQTEFFEKHERKEEKTMAMTAENFVKEIEGMTVLELNTLVRPRRRLRPRRRRPSSPSTWPPPATRSRRSRSSAKSRAWA
jgi:hypothetical protein